MLMTLIGTEGMVPTLLLFDSLPRPARDQPAATEHKRMRVMEAARNDVSFVHGKNKVSLGLRYRWPYRIE